MPASGTMVSPVAHNSSRDFPEAAKKPAIGGLLRLRFGENHRPPPQTEPRLEGAGFCHLRMSDSYVPLR